MKVIFSNKADEDLTGIFKYISGDLRNPIAAHNIVEKILNLAQELSSFPELGANLRIIDTKLADYRYLTADNYLIIYRVFDQEVRILRVIYAKSDYVRLLRG